VPILFLRKQRVDIVVVLNIFCFLSDENSDKKFELIKEKRLNFSVGKKKSINFLSEAR